MSLYRTMPATPFVPLGTETASLQVSSGTGTSFLSPFAERAQAVVAETEASTRARRLTSMGVTVVASGLWASGCQKEVTKEGASDALKFHRPDPAAFENHPESEVGASSLQPSFEDYMSNTIPEGLLLGSWLLIGARTLGWVVRNSRVTKSVSFSRFKKRIEEGRNISPLIKRAAKNIEGSFSIQSTLVSLAEAYPQYAPEIVSALVARVNRRNGARRVLGRVRGFEGARPMSPKLDPITVLVSVASAAQRLDVFETAYDQLNSWIEETDSSDFNKSCLISLSRLEGEYRDLFTFEGLLGEHNRAKFDRHCNTLIRLANRSDCRAFQFLKRAALVFPEQLLRPVLLGVENDSQRQQLVGNICSTEVAGVQKRLRQLVGEKPLNPALLLRTAEAFPNARTPILERLAKIIASKNGVKANQERGRKTVGAIASSDSYRAFPLFVRMAEIDEHMRAFVVHQLGVWIASYRGKDNLFSRRCNKALAHLSAPAETRQATASPARLSVVRG